MDQITATRATRIATLAADPVRRLAFRIETLRVAQETLDRLTDLYCLHDPACGVSDAQRSLYETLLATTIALRAEIDAG